MGTLQSMNRICNSTIILCFPISQHFGCAEEVRVSTLYLSLSDGHDSNCSHVDQVIGFRTRRKHRRELGPVYSDDSNLYTVLLLGCFAVSRHINVFLANTSTPNSAVNVVSSSSCSALGLTFVFVSDVVHLALTTHLAHIILNVV